MKNKPIAATNASEEFRRPLNLPKILDGKFYSNIQPHPKTPGGIQATCTTCFGTISGTTKSTGNFLSHIKRRHKEILPSCQLYCSAKNLSCFTQSDLKFPGNFPMTLTNSPVPLMLSYSTAGSGSKDSKTPEQITTVANSNLIPAIPAFLRSDSSSSSTANNNNMGNATNPANGVFKQSPQHI